MKRKYLYVWVDPVARCVVASGLVFKDFKPVLKGRGVVLIEHQSMVGQIDPQSCLEYVKCSNLKQLRNEDVRDFGNFSWVDFGGDVLPLITPEQTAELLYFGHIQRPLREIEIGLLNNQFLAFTHDDGWYVRVYYREWQQVARLLSKKAPSLTAEHLAALERGDCAYWVQDGVVSEEERTEHMDVLLNRRWKGT